MSALGQSEPFLSPYQDDPSVAPGMLSILRRQKWKILGVLAVVLAGLAPLILLAPDVYQSEARLLNRMGRETLSMDPAIVGPTMDVSANRENETNSELAILKSRILAERVVDKLGPEPFLPGRAAKADSPGLLARLGLVTSLSPREQAIEKFTKNLGLEVEGKSNIINLSLEGPSPAATHAGLDELIRAYLERHIEVYGAQTPPRFFQEQADRLARELTRREDELKQFRLAHQITAMDKQEDALLSQITSLERDVAEAGGQQSASEAKIASLNRSLAKDSESLELSRVIGKTNYAADSMKGRLVELRQKETDLALRYPADARPLTDVRAQIKVLEATLAKESETLTEVTTGVNTNYQALQLALTTEQAQLKAGVARRDSLIKDLARRRAALRELTSQEAALSRLQREVKQLEGEYQRGWESLQRVKASTALDLGKIASIRVVQPATLPLRPLKPKRALLLGISAILGLFGGLGLAYVCEYSRAGKAAGAPGEEYGRKSHPQPLGSA